LSSTAEFAELHNLIVDLQRCVTSLKSQYGDIPAMRRIANDTERIVNEVERLDIDAAELDTERGAAHQYDADAKIPIPDTQHDMEFWRDVDDEGVGGHHGQR
jgi:acyl transferase domain-containing protein